MTHVRESRFAGWVAGKPSQVLQYTLLILPSTEILVGPFVLFSQRMEAGWRDHPAVVLGKQHFGPPPEVVEFVDIVILVSFLAI